MDYSMLAKILVDCFRFESIDYPPSKVVTTAHDNDRNLLYKGRYYSPLIDTIEDDLRARGIECQSIARIASRIKGPLAHGRANSPEGRFARALMAKRLLGVLRRGQYPYSGMEERIWGEILDVTKARRVFGIQPSRELCVACHKRGVWVADVQHGVIAERHPWYGKKFRAADPREQLPDAFLVWDYGSAEVLNRWTKAKGIDARVVGNRWVARFMKPRSDDRLVQEMIAEFNKTMSGRVKKKNILVSLSWGESNIPNGFICPGLEEVMKATSDRIQWMIRLHPNQVRGFAEHEFPKFKAYFSAELRDHAEWEVATRAPLPVLLASSDLHITWWSSTSIEAAQFGIKSAALNPRLRKRDPIKEGYEFEMPKLTASVHISDYYEYYKKLGMIDFVPETAAEIGAWIARNIDREKVPESYEERDQLYGELLAFLSE